ncbi:hypothetical protein ACVWZ7_000436 [Arthrobacter sp. TE12232]
MDTNMPAILWTACAGISLGGLAVAVVLGG